MNSRNRLWSVSFRVVISVAPWDVGRLERGGSEPSQEEVRQSQVASTLDAASWVEMQWWAVSSHGVPVCPKSVSRPPVQAKLKPPSMKRS